MTEEKAIKEAQMYVVAGLSLTIPISVDDVRWAFRKGFNAGRKFNSQIPHNEKEVDRNGKNNM